MRPLFAASALFFVVNPAWAGDCAAPYTIDNLLGDLSGVEQFLREGDNEAAKVASARLEAGLACLDEVLPAMIVGRSFRAVAAGKVAGGDAEGGAAWFRTAAEVEQSFEYGLEDLPEIHPVRDVYADARIAASGEVVVMEEMQFQGGKNFVDGRKMSEPKARLDRPHLFQHEEGAVESWIIQGNGFPSGAVTVAVAVASVDTDVDAGKKGKDPKPPKEPKIKEPKPEKEPKTDVAKTDKEPKPAKEPKAAKPPKTSTAADGSMVIQRQRPWEKTPLMLGGGAIIAGAGGIYAMSLGSRKKFDEAQTLEDIERLQGATNQLAIISIAALAAGTGTFTWGVILDGGAPMPALQWRF